VFGMPRAPIATGCVDFILPIDKIAEAIVNLVNTGAIE
jgi:chemotaxis response regulator CheB